MYVHNAYMENTTDSHDYSTSKYGVGTQSPICKLGTETRVGIDKTTIAALISLPRQRSFSPVVVDFMVVS